MRMLPAQARGSLRPSRGRRDSGPPPFHPQRSGSDWALALSRHPPPMRECDWRNLPWRANHSWSHRRLDCEDYGFGRLALLSSGALTARTMSRGPDYRPSCDASIASTRSFEENGFERYATHPALSAARRVTSSSRAVMKMTGGEIPAASNFRFSSMPEAPFRLISSTRQVAACRFACSMKLSIVWKVSTSNPRALRSRSTAPKTLRSSSRTWISLREIIMLGGWRFLLVVMVIAAPSLGCWIAAPPFPRALKLAATACPCHCP